MKENITKMENDIAELRELINKVPELEIKEEVADDVKDVEKVEEAPVENKEEVEETSVENKEEVETINKLQEEIKNLQEELKRKTNIGLATRGTAQADNTPKGVTQFR